MSEELSQLKGVRQLLEFGPYLKVCNELQKQIDSLGEEINETIGEGQPKFTLMDLKRVERKILKQFLELPENLIQEFDNIINSADEVVPNMEIPEWLRNDMK